MTHKRQWLLGSIAFSSLLLVAGCGGGGGTGVPATSSTATTGTGLAVTGTAATGAPIVNGSVQMICAGGTATTAVLTNADGAYSITTATGTLPCVIKVTGGNGRSATAELYSLFETAGKKAHINQLTHMLVSALAKKNPSSLFSSDSGNIAALFAASFITTQKAIVQTVVAALAAAVGGVAVDFDFLSAADFGAVGVGFDKLLDNISFVEDSTVAGCTAAAPCIVFKATNASMLTITLATQVAGTLPKAGDFSSSQIADLGGLQLFTAELVKRLFLTSLTFTSVTAAQTSLSDILAAALFSTTVANPVFEQVASLTPASGIKVKKALTDLSGFTAQAPTLTSIVSGSGATHVLRVLLNYTATTSPTSTAAKTDAQVARQSTAATAAAWKLNTITP